MNGLKSSISPTGGGQTSPALSFLDRCAIADRELGFTVEKLEAVRDMLRRETNDTGKELIADTIAQISDAIHDLKGRQTILRNMHPLLQRKLAEVQ
jgi:hypothetical protein